MVQQIMPTTQSTRIVLMLFALSCRPTQASSFYSRFMVKHALPRCCFKLDMLSLRREYHEILRGVVEDIAINVMNHFSFFQRPPHRFLCNNSMHVFASDAQIHGGICRLVSPMTRYRTINSITAFHLGARCVKFFGTLRAHRHFSSASEYSRAHLRAKNPFAWLRARFAKIHVLSIGNKGVANQWFSPACLRPQRSLFDDGGME